VDLSSSVLRLWARPDDGGYGSADIAEVSEDYGPGIVASHLR
jgi:hypothetical protein